jgi:hypothetical protein
VERNRYQACQLAGVEPQFREWDGNGSLVMFVYSLNFHRRHLTTNEKAMSAARMREAFEEEARERQRGGQGSVLLPPNLEGARGEVAEKAAELFNVSRAAVYSASKVLREATEDLITAVKQGEE